MLTYARAKEAFYFDYENNLLRWKIQIHRSKFKIGDVAGNNSGKSGYPRVHLDGTQTQVHIIVWMLHNKRDVPHGKLVDHRNRIKTDFTPSNLRLATNSENICNQKINSQNKLGVKNVSFRNGWYRVRVMKDGKRSEKIFRTIDEAIHEATNLRNKLHLEYANHGTFAQ